MARALILMAALEEEERVETLNRRAQISRELRDNANPLALDDKEFRAHYRLSKLLYLDLCEELTPFLDTPQRRSAVSIECKILTALSFFATGSYQKPVGMSFLHGLSQPSVSNAVRDVTWALNVISILQKYIRFPQTREERLAVINGFYSKFGFPGILGCIDGTHVALIRPSEHEERFFNRKHYHSRNVQIICDSDLNILNVDATFGGASHDSYIWRQSEINHHMMQELHNNGEAIWLLGDSGYPLRPWLLTPIQHADPISPEENYTKIHCRTRNTIERCIGVLKARWRCLLVHRVLHYDHDTVAKMINACCVLHNIANRARLPVPQLSPDEARIEITNQEQHSNYVDNLNEHQLLQSGRRQQSMIVQRLWNSRVVHS